MERNFTYNLLDNFIGYDDGLMTPGERLGASINRLATGLYEDPIGMVGAVARDTVGDLNYLMFQGGAEREPERVFGYAAAPMAPGALRGHVANVVSSGGTKPKKGITAYHGSPHDFDRFSMDKIGTGEGAQAYGHGLYFAENEAVAKWYRDQLSQLNNSAKNRAISAAGGDVKAAIADTKSKIAHYENLAKDPNSADRANRLLQINRQKLDDLESGAGASGSMYEVRINADPDDFLDWGAPLRDQRGKAKSALDSFFDWYAGGPEGRQELYDAGIELRDIQNNFDDLSPAQFASAMRSRGVPGSKFRDAASRGRPGSIGNDETRNFVVFDENLIEIVRKYGIAGAAAMLGISAQELQAQIGGDQ